jgi:gas vesicle protein
LKPQAPNNCRCIHLNTERKSKTSFPSKANSTTKDLNNCIEEEIPNIELQKLLARMINELKEETQKLVSDLKENVNKELNELKENTNK